MKNLFIKNMFLAAIALMAAGAVSCSDDDDDVVLDPTITIADAQKAHTIAWDEVEGCIEFTAGAPWTASVVDLATRASNTEISWLKLTRYTGDAGTIRMPFLLTKNDDEYTRDAQITLQCEGGTPITVTVHQENNPDAPHTMNPSEIANFDKYYVPSAYNEHFEKGVVGLLRTDGYYSFDRMAQSEHFFVFWSPEFGANPNADSVKASMRVDIDDLLAKAEQFYKTNVERLGMVTVGEGKSYLDQYKMQIYLIYQDEWLATGSGYDNVIGALWVNPSTCQPVGPTIAHEIGHSFQYQVYCDQVLNGAPNDFTTGFRYGYEGSNGGNGFWEQCAQWQSYQDYPEQYFGDGWYSVWPNNCHRHFEHEWMRYASYWLHCYWTEKHGDKTLASIWQQSKYPNDAIQTYQQLYCGDDWNACAAELYDYAARMATYDVAGPRDYSADHLNDYRTTFYDTEDGYYQVAYGKCPGCTGFNVIPLNVAAGTTISADFVGLEVGSALVAEDPGNVIDGDNNVVAQVRNYNNVGGEAGWRYGFVAYLSDGSRQYSSMFSGNKATVSYDVPTNTELLYMVVMGAPTNYVQSAWDENELTDAQYPYMVRFNGTDLLGNFNIDKTAAPKDITLQYTVNAQAASEDWWLGALDLSTNQELAQAFVLQPSAITSKIQDIGAEPSEGKIVWGCLQSDGTYSYTNTAAPGFWCDTNGDNVGWSNGYAYVEFTGLTINYGQYPGKNEAGSAFKLTPTLIYTKDGVQYKAAVEISYVYE